MKRSPQLSTRNIARICVFPSLSHEWERSSFHGRTGEGFRPSLHDCEVLA
jgi:hypothetical protein